ncbi:Nudix family hydrolase [Paludibacterium paludis]|uniref:8-oxo-dGTP diphosphatase n=1 Tax=Paludibacterium paludis TaxID=1225769 RepID=A0A918P7C3_9NEIS|nr:Nudix family hydrolase [Paludibacterium paludis]GGY27156.1 hypothetical protein GCM10011289_33220 [Paludibacterium paludis]
MTEKTLIDVVAGVLIAPDGRFMLASRPEGKPWAGWWEFPGGKVESGEAPLDALARELDEELGIRVLQAEPWLTRVHHYDHASVRLRFFRVRAWEGEVRAREGQGFAWQRSGEVSVEPVLPANGPLLDALSLPEICRVTCAGTVGAGTVLDGLDRLPDPGLVVVREPGMPDAERAQFATQVLGRVAARGGRAVLNGTPEEAARLGMSGVHLTAARLLALDARPDLPLVGASVHNRAELDAAARLELDYVLLGHVLPTASHPDQPPLGWDGLARLLAEGWPMPVFGLGGLSADDLTAARGCGAHGVALMRNAFTQ